MFIAVSLTHPWTAEANEADQYDLEPTMRPDLG